MLNYWIDETDNEDCKLITSMPVDIILYPKRKEIVRKTNMNIIQILFKAK